MVKRADRTQTPEAAAQSRREEGQEVAATPQSLPVQVVPHARSIGGKRLIIGIAVAMVLIFAFNVYTAKTNQRTLRQRTADAKAFNTKALVTQEWKRAVDGMVLTATAEDAATIASIRRYLKHQRTEYLRGDYSDSKFGNDDIPGRADLEFGTTHGALNCRYSETAKGATLTWIALDGDMKDSQKDIMIASLTEWASKVATSPVVELR
jgi:hypothetical protein